MEEPELNEKEKLKEKVEATFGPPLKDLKDRP